MMYFILIAAFTVVVSTISYGLVEFYKEEIEGKAKIKRALKVNISMFLPIICAALIFMIPNIAHAATVSEVSSGQGMGYIGAALSTGLAAVGAGYAVGATGSSALGAISEDPKILGKTLIYVGLGEGIAIYGLIMSIIILSRL